MTLARMSTRWVCPACAGVLVTALFAGCGPTGPTVIPIRGEVIYKGAPLKEGTVVYLPKETGEARQASGRIQADGSFVLTTFKNADGVAPGDYDIVVYAFAPQAGNIPTRAELEAAHEAGRPQRQVIIPEKYTNPETSGLSDTVDSDHSGFKRIELTE
jgi:hypothetical protein